MSQTRRQGPVLYTALRLGQIGALGANAVLLAHLLPVSQYSLYARGAFFATGFTAVYFFGQDQLAYRHRLGVETLRRRVTVIQLLVGAIIALLAATTTPTNVWPVIASSCAGTALMMITTVTWVGLQIEGRDTLRSGAQLTHGVTIQLGATLAAACGGGGLAATNASTAVSVLWAAGSLAYRGRRIDNELPARTAVAAGVAGTSYGLMATVTSIVIAARASDNAAAQDRFLLLAFGTAVALSGALNSEYFRARLLRPDTGESRSLRRNMVRVNSVVVAASMAGLVAAGALAREVLPRGYSGVGRYIIELAAVVPALFIVTAAFNIDMARGHTAVAAIRNCLAPVVALCLMEAFPPTPPVVLAVVVVVEWAGAVVVVLSWSVRAMRRLPADRRYPA